MESPGNALPGDAMSPQILGKESRTWVSQPLHEAYHTATATILMTDSLRHWQKLSRGAPLSPMRPSMMPEGQNWLH